MGIDADMFEAVQIINEDVNGKPSISILFEAHKGLGTRHVAKAFDLEQAKQFAKEWQNAIEKLEAVKT